MGDLFVEGITLRERKRRTERVRGLAEDVLFKREFGRAKGRDIKRRKEKRIMEIREQAREFATTTPLQRFTKRTKQVGKRLKRISKQVPFKLKGVGVHDPFLAPRRGRKGGEMF